MSSASKACVCVFRKRWVRVLVRVQGYWGDGMVQVRSGVGAQTQRNKDSGSFLFVPFLQQEDKRIFFFLLLKRVKPEFSTVREKNPQMFLKGIILSDKCD